MISSKQILRHSSRKEKAFCCHYAFFLNALQIPAAPWDRTEGHSLAVFMILHVYSDIQEEKLKIVVYLFGIMWFIFWQFLNENFNCWLFVDFSVLLLDAIPKVVSLLYDVISALSVACSQDNGVGLRLTQALFRVYTNIMWAVPRNKTFCMNAVPDVSVWGSFEGPECRRGLVQQRNGSTSAQLHW